ncbi:MAG TPA: hypothetical protein VLR89_10150 [Anaerolineaceae bacterium]|nr:hypothetical protein [Anaerolineaceae bacterium]
MATLKTFPIIRLKPTSLLVLFTVCLLVLSACQRATPPPDPTATPTPLPTNTLQPTILIENGTEIMVAQPANPTATPNFENPNPVQVSELQFFQRDYRVQVIAKLQNTLNNVLLRDISYEIILLDTDGNRLTNTYGAIKYLFPRETVGVVAMVDLPPGLIATNLQLQITGGKQEQGQKYTQPLSVSGSTANTVPSGQMATAWLVNKDVFTYTQASLNAIAYDNNGEIICGGSKAQEFIPSNDKIGVSVQLMDCPEPPAVVDFYAFLTPQSAALPDGPWQNNIELSQWNFIVNDLNQMTGGVELKNLTDRTLTRNFFVLTAADANGKVCLAENKFLDALWPSEQTGFSLGIFDLPINCNPETAYLKVIPGEFGLNPLAYNPLIASNASIVVSEERTFVKVRVINNLNTTIPNALVSIVIKDTSGKIVGAGTLMTQSIPASGMLEVEVPSIFTGDINTLKPSASVTIPDGVITGK